VSEKPADPLSDLLRHWAQEQSLDPLQAEHLRARVTAALRDTAFLDLPPPVLSPHRRARGRLLWFAARAAAGLLLMLTLQGGGQGGEETAGLPCRRVALPGARPGCQGPGRQGGRPVVCQAGRRSVAVSGGSRGHPQDVGRAGGEPLRSGQSAAGHEGRPTHRRQAVDHRLGASGRQLALPGSQDHRHGDEPGRGRVGQRQRA